MDDLELFEYTAAELSKMLQSKEVSSLEVTKAYLDRINSINDSVNAYITVLDDRAKKQAQKADELIAKGEYNALCGLPIAIKDNMSTKGVITTCASRMLSDYVPPYDANVVSILNEKNAVTLGKLNMDEFAMGSSNENSYFGSAHNPHNLDCVTGGSSGGSTAAIAAGMAAITLGSDTGGSIRQPASLCGVVGMKPTYGRVSRYGLIAFASSLDQIGPLGRSVVDCAMMLDAIAVGDSKDSTSIRTEKAEYAAALTGDIKGKKIGLPKEYFTDGIDQEVKDAIMAAAKQYEDMGAIVEECSLPLAEYALEAYYLVSSAEASSNLARYDGVRYGFRAEGAKDHEEMFIKSRSQGFGKEVKRRIMLGAYVLSAGYYDAYYKKAQQVRTLIMQDFDKLFGEYDFLLTPASPTTAWKIGANIDDPLKMYSADICTVPVNIAGLPSIVLPCGMGEGDMPIGMQLIGKTLSDAQLLNTAYAYEKATNMEIRPMKVEG